MEGVCAEERDAAQRKSAGAPRVLLAMLDGGHIYAIANGSKTLGETLDENIEDWRRGGTGYVPSKLARRNQLLDQGRILAMLGLPSMPDRQANGGSG